VHVALATPEWYADEQGGGIGTYTRVLATQTARLGHRVTVLAATLRRDRRATTRGAISVVPIAGDGPADVVARRFHQAWTWLLARDHPDVLEAPEFGGVVAHILAEGCEVPSTTRLHTPLSLILVRGEQATIYADDAVRCLLEREQTAASDLVTSPSRWLADVVRRLWGLTCEIRVVPNPLALPPGRAAPLPPSPAGKARGLRISYVGRLEHRKGVLVLAQALRTWAARGGSFDATFAGSDTKWHGVPMSDRIVASVGEVPPGSRVRVVGPLPTRSFGALWRATDVAVLPSLYENFPYACLEAMAAGRAVVATTGSGFEEIIDDRTGVLVPPGDATALVEVLETLASRPGLLHRLGREAARSVERFDASVIVPRLLVDLGETLRTRRAL
jgi:glycogen(starch) synthase